MSGRRRKALSGKSPHPGLAATAARAGVAPCRADDERIFRTIFDHAAVGIWESTPDGRYVRVNPRCADIMGYRSPAEVVASIGDIAHQVYVDPLERDRFKRELGANG